MDVEAVGGVAQSVEAPAFLSGRTLVQVQLPSTSSPFLSLFVPFGGVQKKSRPTARVELGGACKVAPCGI
jgi:hypothetical protein